eukprot:NODE_1742_length_751_cov_66.993590_g1693_i0.p1 GENE.NODE_1742_length_751_cov_66.993590_g1693_i0~~NODE_1742_length_751_cov_66.993590_g1693_i0.p1  ORF type:complete len:197 (-),score=45.43 NODE_1742_length_751_cov_66.993590_g1693_i0:96-686(-)
MSTSARKKLKKSIRAEPSPLEDEVAQALFDLEMTHNAFKNVLKDVYVNSVKESEVGVGSKAVLIFYPLRFGRKLRKVQRQLVTELEKKFSGKSVLFIGQRKIARQSKSAGRKIQRSRTLTAVHTAILDDLVFPADVVGKRLKYKADGTKAMRVFLDTRDRDKTEARLDAVKTVYKKLTGKEISISYMSNPSMQQIV